MNIEETIKKHLFESIDDITSIEIKDVTHKHHKHKTHEQGKYHIKLSLSSEKLSQLSRITAHRNIYKALSSLMQKEIHSLVIELK